MPWTVYQLRVEGEAQPFYVGCTSRTSHRQWVEQKHRAKTGDENSARGTRIREAEVSGKTILVEDLETYETMEEAHAREVYWIAYHGRAPDGQLVNDEPGGTGVGKYISGEARRKMAEAKIGNTINEGRSRPDFREKTRKDVTVFKDTGERVASFETARLASEVTGVHWKTISDVLRKKKRTARGYGKQVYQFRYGIIEQNIEPVKFRSRR